MLAGDRAAAARRARGGDVLFRRAQRWVLLAGQLPLAIAGDGLFPRAFGRLSARGVPARGIVIGSVLSTILIAMNYSREPRRALHVHHPARDAQHADSLRLLRARRVPDPDGPDGTRSRANLGGSIAAALAFGYALWAIAGAGADVVYWGFLLLIAGLPVYVWGPRRR